MGLLYSKSIPDEISERYTQIFKIINDSYHHIELKKYLLNEEISLLNSFKVNETLNYSIYPENKDIIYLFGLFSISPNIYIFIKIFHFGRSNFNFEIKESYINSLSNKHIITSPNIIDITDIYDKIVDTIENKNFHIEVKKHIINSYLDKLKLYEVYGSSSKLVYPLSNNYIVISGIYACSTPNGYTYIHISNLNNCDNYDKLIYNFKIGTTEILPLKEIDIIDENLVNGKSIPILNVLYDENGSPIPPILQSDSRKIIDIAYDENGIPVPPPLPPN